VWTVKWIQGVKAWWDRRRLRAALRTAPSSRAFADLAQLHLATEQWEQAERVAERGLEVFSDSDELGQLRAHARGSRLESAIRLARTRVNKRPSAQGYQALAELHLEHGGYPAVCAIAEEWTQKFPGDPVAYMSAAVARLKVFYGRLRARDGLLSVHNLIHVIRLDPGNVKARRLIAEVLYRVGGVGRSVGHLEKLVALVPGDRHAKALLHEVRAGRSVEGGVETLFRAVEERGRMVNGSAVKASACRGSEAQDLVGHIRSRLGRLSQVEGVTKACCIRGSSAIVKGGIHDGKDEFLRVVRVAAKAAQRVSRRMELGTFRQVAIAGDFGHICVCSSGDVVAAAQCDSGRLVDDVLTALQEVVTASAHAHGRASR